MSTHFNSQSKHIFRTKNNFHRQMQGKFVDVLGLLTSLYKEIMIDALQITFHTIDSEKKRCFILTH